MIFRPYYYFDLGCAAFEALSDVPPKPAAMARVLAFNRGHEEAGARA